MSIKITAETLVNRPDDLLSSKVDDEVIMMRIDSGKYYGLNAMGSKIWDLIKSPIAISDLCWLLMNEFDVDEATCQRQTIALMEKLAQRNLIHIKK